MADDERRNPDEPWVAPPLGSEGASGGTYADPFAATSGQGYAQPVPPPLPQASPGSYSADPYAQPGRVGQPTETGTWTQPYGQPYAATGLPGAPRTDKDWMGIASLVTSILGISLVAVILGHLGLKANARGEANNRGIALAGTIIGWIGMVLALFGLIVAIAIPLLVTERLGTTLGDDAYTWEDTTPDGSATDDPYAGLAQPGDGVFGFEEASTYFVVYLNGDASTGTCLAPSFTAGYDLDFVDCAEPHVGEIYHFQPLGSLMVGDDAYSDESWAAYSEACDAAFAPFVDESGLAITNQWLFAASDDENPSADDTFLCVASDDFSETTGSITAGGGGQIY